MLYGFFVFLIFIIIIYSVLRNPFTYPIKYIIVDVTGKRQPDSWEMIDEYINEHGDDFIFDNEDRIDAWIEDMEKIVRRSILRGYRKGQLEEEIASNAPRAYCFEFVRYRRRNGRIVNKIVEDTVYCDYDKLRRRNIDLHTIGYETTLLKYHSKNQRKLMTSALRKEIMERDNYTCQMCGKEMFDRVGLQIDHITPVSKGGKTIKPNLQVLCSVCNGRKSDKM